MKTNSFCRSDPGRLVVILLLLASPVLHAASGTWLPNAGGNWSNPANWVSGAASGTDSTASFTNDITTSRTVTLDAPVTIGKLVFADANVGTPAEWTLAGISALTLSVTSGTPEITTSGEITHIAAPLAGPAFTKKGSGTLELSAANAFTTPTLGFASADSGILLLTHSGSLGGITTVAMPGNNLHVSRIDLSGNVSLTANITTAGRSASAFLRNISGNNAWTGSVSITSTGGSYAIESQAGTLTLGPVFNAISLARILSLTGSGNGVAAGIISNGTGGSLGITKNGTGNWKFSAVNTYSGTTEIAAGTLEIATGGTLGTGAVTNNSQLTFSQSGNLTVPNVISGTGSLAFGSSSILTLSGINSYSGGTTVTGTGTLSFADDSALGSGLIQLGATPGSGQCWFHSAGDRTLANNFEIRTQRWIIDGNTVNGNTAGNLTVTGAAYLNQTGAKDIYCNRNLTLCGALTSTGGLIKQGGSTLILAGAASYSGATSVAAGTLRVNGSITSAGTTTVSTGAFLTGTGSVSGPVTISSGGDLIPGLNGAGTLACGNLTLSAGADLRLTAGAPADSSNTRIAVTGNLSRNGTLFITERDGFTSGTYTLATFTGNLTGTGFQSIVLPVGYAGNLITTTPNQLKLQVFLATPVAPLNNVMLSFEDFTALGWAPMTGATGYRVYLGTNSSTVANATTSTVGTYLGQTPSTTYNAAGFTSGTPNYWRIDYLLADGTVLKGPVWNFTLVQENDLMADTWVATDALNRVLPDAAKAGPPRDDRPIAIFYFLWHGANGLGNDGPRDNTKEINRLGGYTNKNNPWADNPLWMSGANGRSWYWGEPEAGYYSSDDEWVIRRHISLLVAAGVDILAFDNTNGHPESYQEDYVKIAETIRKMRREGMKIDLKFLFLTHGGTGGSTATMTWLYENFYKPGLYPEMWLTWDGKPAIVGYPDGIDPGDTPVSAEIRNFFTFRTGWANVSTLQREWQWIDSTTPQNWGYNTRADIPEQVPVACGGWCNGNLGRSYYNRSQPTYDKWHLTTARTEGQGLFFSEQSFYGRKLDPKLLFITGWNEWWAGAWTAPSSGGGYNVLDNNCAAGQRYFVDNYNAEYSRDIEPMKGGHGDNYYYQMVAANRLRKGARTAPFASPVKTVSSPAGFDDVGPAYYDAPDETLPRNAPATFSNLSSYTNTSGRNDFRVMKVARDATNLYFYAETKAAITTASGDNWMLLFLDTDQSRATGWEGYDYALNLGGSGQVKRFTGTTWTPTAAGSATVSVTGNRIMITVPRATVGLTADPLKFDFHWADNIPTSGDIADFGLSGDSAPERRFNYRYQAAPVETVILRQDSFEPGDNSSLGTGSSWGETFAPGTQWRIATTTPYSGNQCLVGTGATTTTDPSGTLINRTSTAGLDSLRVAFRYKLANVQDAQNINIYFRNSTNQWVLIRELGRDQFHSSGQAWGYDERQNVWLYFSDARLNSGTDATWFHPNFAIHIQIKGLNSATQTIALDDFQISGTRAVAAPMAASSPGPTQGSTGIATSITLTWSPGTGATTQNIYFGTPGNLTLLGSGDGTTSSQLPSTLTPNTNYQWRIDSVNAAGTTPGPTWSFTTAPPPNTAPVLNPIPDQSVIAGQTLSFTASATDPDVPAQTLGFTLENPPPGAAIGPASGIFTWRPTQGQAPVGYTITVKVTDNGTPALAVQRQLNVQVAKPALPATHLFHTAADGVFSLQITGDPGPDYRVWASENLEDWSLIKTYESAIPPLLLEDVDSKVIPKRFYKVDLGP